MGKAIAYGVVCFVVGLAVGVAATLQLSPRPPAPGIGPQRFVEGYAKNDGRLIWSSYSPAYQQTLAASGTGESQTVAMYAWFQQRKAGVDSYRYLGGYQTRDYGVYLYLVRTHDETGAHADSIWYFTTDANGLITYIM